MGIKDLIGKAFRKTGPAPANDVRQFAEVSDKDIKEVFETLSNLVAKSKEELDEDSITSIREEALEVAPAVEGIVDNILDTLLDKELEALELQIEQDAEEAIVVGNPDLNAQLIAKIKAVPMDPKQISNSFTEQEIVDAGESLKAETNIRFNKNKNAEILHEAIFGER